MDWVSVFGQRLASDEPDSRNVRPTWHGQVPLLQNSAWDWHLARSNERPVIARNMLHGVAGSLVQVLASLVHRSALNRATNSFRRAVPLPVAPPADSTAPLAMVAMVPLTAVAAVPLAQVVEPSRLR